MEQYYHYTECGLENVWVGGVGQAQDAAGRTTYTIKNIAGLHRAIAQAVVRKSRLMGEEIRFLRTELGKTQEELAQILHVSGQSVGRWERDEVEIDKNAETVLRALAIQELRLGHMAKIEKLSALSVAKLDDGQIVIDCCDGEYRLRPLPRKRAAAA